MRCWLAHVLGVTTARRVSVIASKPSSIQLAHLPLHSVLCVHVPSLPPPIRKTFTTEGFMDDPDMRGIIPRSVEEIFNCAFSHRGGGDPCALLRMRMRIRMRMR